MKKALILLIGIVVIGLGFLAFGLNANNIVHLDSNPLTDKMWLLTTYNGQPPITGHRPTLQFEIDQVSGTTGCNHYGGGYQINGESFRFDGLYSTEMACLEPEGLIEQELVYLELLMTADRYELNDGILTIFAESNPILVFEIQSDEPVLAEPTHEPADPVSVDVVTPTTAPVFMPPEGFIQYQDPVTAVSIYIPETWSVTGIIEGRHAILQSYPEDKYIGGERREEGDTKCDLNIRPPGTLMDDLLQQWRSDSRTTILSEHDITLGTGYPAKRIEANSMGRSNSVITQINERVIVLTCFGDFAPFDAISNTLGTE